MSRKAKVQEAKVSPKTRSRKSPAKEATPPPVAVAVVVAKTRKRSKNPPKGSHGGARSGAGHPLGLKTGVNTKKRCLVLPLDVEEQLIQKSEELHISIGRVAARLLENALGTNLPLAPKRKGVPDPEPEKKQKKSKGAKNEVPEIEVLPNGVTFIRSEFATERAKEIITAAKELQLTPGQYVAQLAVEAFSAF